MGCHVLFLATYAYMAGFVGDFAVPKTIDSPGANGPSAVVIDLALIVLFGMQHSVMARPWFKKHWTRIVAEPIERSTYVLVSCVVSFILMWQWRAIDGVIWDVRLPAGRGLLWLMFAAGWLLVPAVSFMINHFDLFGTRQVWLYLCGRPYSSLPFRTPLLYARVRHPLYLGWTLAFWATPSMSPGHLLFAGALTLYMAVAVIFEERDLVAYFGDAYRDYRRRVPMFLPRLAGRRGAAPAPRLLEPLGES